VELRFLQSGGLGNFSRHLELLEETIDDVIEGGGPSRRFLSPGFTDWEVADRLPFRWPHSAFGDPFVRNAKTMMVPRADTV
jgi:hypothetical protein